MRGLITSREVVRHAFTIIRLRGPRAFARCVRATVPGTPATFLVVVAGGGVRHG